MAIETKPLAALLIVVLALSLTRGVVLAAPPDQEAGGQAYVVQKDDWLSKIAEKYYGDPLAYPAIVEATNAKAAEDDSYAVISDPNVIEVGQHIWLPEHADPQVVELADGTRCLHAGYGATLAFDGKRLNYTCGRTGEDEVGLLGDFQTVEGVSMGEKAVIGHDESGFSLKESHMVPISRLSYTATDLRVEALRNTAYQGIYEQPVQLADGRYEGESFVPDGASRPTVAFLDAFYAFGDLNDDGLEDAAVTLAENSGGSGTFIYLAVLVSRDGALANVATQLLGDRVNLKSLAIADGQIVMTMVSHGPDDPMCCPSLESIVRYRLEGNRLVKQGD